MSNQGKRTEGAGAGANHGAAPSATAPARLMTKKEAASVLRVSTRTMDNYCRSGIVPFIALPGGRHFDPQQIQTFLYQRTFRPAAAPSTDSPVFHRLQDSEDARE